MPYGEGRSEADRPYAARAVLPVKSSAARRRSCHHPPMIARPPLAVPLLALGGFLVLLALVVGDWAPLNSFDASVSAAFREYGHRHPDVVAVLRILTDVVAPLPFLIGGLIASLALLGRGWRRAALLCAVATVVVPVLWGLLHGLVHQPRPLAGFVTSTSNGFPSGHTANGATVALVAVLLLWSRLARTGRIVLVTLATAFAIFIGVTRLALLAHWPADVLGGWLLVLGVVPLAARWTGTTTVPGAADRDGTGTS